MKESKGYINSVETMGLVDGPGIRVVLFLQGCPLRCLFCHNPETWKKKSKIIMTPAEVTEKVLRYKNYFMDEGGVTFSGGEPLMQRDFLVETMKLCKKNHIHTALDTSGVGTDYIKVLEYTDLVIWDVKAYTKEAYLKMTGLPIETSLTFLKTCQDMHKKMWIRQVIVPGINDTEEYILGLRAFLKKLKYIEKVELLPYETLGVDKYRELEMVYPLKGVPPMDIERCRELEKLLVQDL